MHGESQWSKRNLEGGAREKMGGGVEAGGGVGIKGGESDSLHAKRACLRQGKGCWMIAFVLYMTPLTCTAFFFFTFFFSMS